MLNPLLLWNGVAGFFLNLTILLALFCTVAKDRSHEVFYELHWPTQGMKSALDIPTRHPRMFSSGVQSEIRLDSAQSMRE